MQNPEEPSETGQIDDLPEDPYGDQDELTRFSLWFGGFYFALVSLIIYLSH